MKVSFWPKNGIWVECSFLLSLAGICICDYRARFGLPPFSSLCCRLGLSYLFSTRTLALDLRLRYCINRFISRMFYFWKNLEAFGDTNFFRNLHLAECISNSLASKAGFSISLTKKLAYKINNKIIIQDLILYYYNNEQNLGSCKSMSHGKILIVDV